MKEYGLTVLVAATVTYLLTPLVRKFAIWFGAWHEPRERDVHTEPVPELGGLAIFCGVAAALLVASRMFPLSGVFAGTRVGSGLLLAGGVVVLMGVVDDRWGLGALTKLVGQIGAGAILVWSGAVVGWLPLPGGGTLALSPDQQTALTILLVVMTINAVNFIDGLDGLATGIVGIGAAAFYLYYYTLAKRLGLSEQTDPALASAVLAGVCLGFLPHNFHPARIFLGDTGAMLLGLLLAYVPISSLASLDPNTLTAPSAYSGGTVNRFPEILPLLLPATILLIPYVDLLLAVVRRTRAGQSPWHADKKHLHHRLLDIGHSHRTSVLIMYLWATLFAGTVVLLSIIRTKLPILGVVTLAGFLVLLWLTMPRLRPWARRGASRRAPAGTSPPPAAAPGRPGPASPAAQAAAAGQAGPAGYRGPAGYDPPGSHEAPARYDAPAGYDPGVRYGAAGHRTVAAAGLAGLSGRDGRSAAGLSGGAELDAGRRGDNGGMLAGGRAGYGGNGQGSGHGGNGGPGSGHSGNGRPGSGRTDDGHLGGGQAGHGYPAGGQPEDRYPAGGQRGDLYPVGGQREDGYPVGGQREDGYPVGGQREDGYPAGGQHGDGYRAGAAEAGPASGGNAEPAGPPWATPAGSRWDAPPESHWDAPAAAPRWAAPAGQAEPERAGAARADAERAGAERADTEPAGTEWAGTEWADAEPAGTEPAADAGQQPEAGRPAWPGDYPEAQEPLLPWRFG